MGTSAVTRKGITTLEEMVTIFEEEIKEEGISEEEQE